MRELSRLERARAILDELHLDALLVSRPAASRWLSGFVLQPMEVASSGYAGTLLLTHDDAVILADPRYTEQAAADCDRDWRVVRTDGPLSENLAGLLRGVNRLGAEARTLSHADWTAIARALPQVELVPSDTELTRLRLRKDDFEVAALRSACELTDACFAYLCGHLAVGQTGRQIAAEIARWFSANGADGLAFDPLVLPGAAAARPHGRTDDEAFRSGEPVLIDFGCVVDGYHSDMTRTVFLGGADERQRALYACVAAAQLRGEEVAATGASGAETHLAARTVLDAAGVGEAFTHGLGHGIGLQIHEEPFLKHWAEPLDAGMAFTLEPGVYLSGEIGIRIEDDYHLTDAGLVRLTRAARDLIVI